MNLRHEVMDPDRPTVPPGALVVSELNLNNRNVPLGLMPKKAVSPVRDVLLRR